MGFELSGHDVILSSVTFSILRLMVTIPAIPPKFLVRIITWLGTTLSTEILKEIPLGLRIIETSSSFIRACKTYAVGSLVPCTSTMVVTIAANIS